MKAKIKQLQELARDMIGDEKTPNLFFVSEQGVIITVTRDFEIAYTQWKHLEASFFRVECALEDRRYGTICSVEPRTDDMGNNKQMITIDDSDSFRRMYLKK